MRLTRIEVRGLRSLRKPQKLAFHPQFNLIAGANAAGKTTLLEAIDLLSRGRSFRTRNARELISHGDSEYLIAGEVASPGESGEQRTRLGLRRDAAATELRLDGEPAKSIAELASRIAVQVIHQGSHELVAGAPALRRAWLDWGVFHVEPDYHSAWATYRKALRQRNAALRARKDPSPWDRPLAEAGEAMDGQRRLYLDTVRECVQRFAAVLLPGQELEMAYQAGFGGSAGLLGALAAARDASLEAGHTVVGPHRADVALRLDGRAAGAVVSGGQAKLLSCCLLLAQVLMFQEMRAQGCILLFDELASDLDRARQGLLVEALGLCEAQLFLTRLGGGEEPPMAAAAGRMFHVEQGTVRQLGD